jgi:hypothetical protein
MIERYHIPLQTEKFILRIMTKESRTDVQIYSAIAMLLAGVALAAFVISLGSW